jgi:hypothetical protein
MQPLDTLQPNDLILRREGSQFVLFENDGTTVLKRADVYAAAANTLTVISEGDAVES